MYRYVLDAHYADFACHSEHAIYQEVGQKKFRPSVAGMARQWGPDLLDLIYRLWAQSPSDRPTMADTVAELQGLIALRKRS